MCGLDLKQKKKVFKILPLQKQAFIDTELKSYFKKPEPKKHIL